jgi:hypothetical protein
MLDKDQSDQASRSEGRFVAPTARNVIVLVILQIISVTAFIAATLAPDPVSLQWWRVLAISTGVAAIFGWLAAVVRRNPKKEA